MRKQVKRALALLLAVVMLSGAWNILSFTAAAESFSGTCGTNVTWTLDTGTGELALSGTGPTKDYAGDTPVPWLDHWADVKTVTVGAGITSMGNHLFDECDNLTAIFASEDSATYSSDENGVLYNKDKTVLVKFPAGKADKTFAIPASVTRIGYGAFSGCRALTSVSIPDGVTGIGFYAFCNCSGLTEMNIPDSVTIIDSDAFYGCTGLTEVTIPTGVKSLTTELFYGCTGLVKVNLPAGLEIIGISTFRGCTSLKKIRIPDSVTTVGDFAFADCKSLPGVVVGNSVVRIGYGTFSDCDKLAWVAIPLSMIRVDGCAFSGCTNLKTVYYAGTKRQWRGMLLHKDNKEFTSAGRHYEQYGVPTEKIYDYKSNIRFFLDPSEELAEGGELHWIVKGHDSVATACRLEGASKTFTVQARVIKDGKVAAESDIMLVRINSSFFAKLMWIIKSGWIGILPGTGMLKTEQIPVTLHPVY